MITGAKKAKANAVQILLGVVLLAVVAFVVWNVFQIFTNTERDRANRDVVAGIRLLSSELTTLVRDATSGSEEAFDTLEQNISKMDADWKALQRDLGEETSDGSLRSMDKSWNIVKGNAETILRNKDTILYLHKVAATLRQTLPELQQELIQVVDTLIEGRAPGDQVAKAQEQAWLAERIGRNIDKMLAGGSDAEQAADQFNHDANLFGRVLEGMKSGDRVLGITAVNNRAARKSLEVISERFEFVSGEVQAIFESTPALFSARQANDGILDESAGLLNEITGLTETIDALPAQRQLTMRTALLGSALIVLILVLMGVISWASTRKSFRETTEANNRNQEAILRLLDEISDLADGDLTSHATVTEDFTGAIADSINYAIDQLRILVSRIVDTAENVSAATNETRATALQLSEASEHQAQEILGASAAINQMAVTIDQVSTNASESAVVAERSVSIAKKGGEVVRDTITGMDTIREQIQDTSKRIKRLGESSQEIGDIVSLINEIADQTNILALNAAIQASMAGEAGRGFAVVADEVQGLAERSASATKQIASLVKTIQTDTNEAVNSMEQTTTQVVKGAELAHNAGGALEEIEKVSADLAELIQDISTAARQQAKTAGHVSGTMNVIQEISSQTLAGASATATSIGELADMAVDMRNSVSGFKLPDMPVVSMSGGFVKSGLTPEEDPAEIGLDDHSLPGAPENIEGTTEQPQSSPYDQLQVESLSMEDVEPDSQEFAALAEDTADSPSSETFADETLPDISDSDLLVSDTDLDSDDESEFVVDLETDDKRS